MLGALATLAKQAAIAGGTALGRVLVRAVSGALKRAADTAPGSDPADATPFTYKHVEHNRRQEQQALEASRAEAARRNAITERPPGKSGKVEP